MRRMFWFCLGVATGAWATVTIKKKLIDLGQRLTPANVLTVLIDGARRVLEMLLELWKTQVVGSSKDSVAPGGSTGSAGSDEAAGT